MPREESPTLPTGLYEQVVDRHLCRLLQLLDDRLHAHIAPIEAAEGHAVLAQYLGRLLERVLARCPRDRRVALCNRIVALLAEADPEGTPLERALVDPARQLLALTPLKPLAQDPPERPQTPLATSCLLTGTRVDPSLVSQLRRELATADRVDLLCSFIRWSGIRVLEEELRALAQRPEARLRVITTAYLGATEPRALDFLAELPNTELRVSYDTRRTRLHAKAYIFHRATGFGTGYVGSSNLSNAALTDGLEWNVKISQYETPHLWEKLCATFDTYWHDSEFVAYSAAERERFRLAVREQRGAGDDTGPVFLFELRPYSYQQQILDRLAAERQYHGRWRNLIVAATGTGKTVIAAFDYRRFREQRTREAPELELPYPCLLELHAAYTRDQVLAALGAWTPERPRNLREGVAYLPEIQTDVFFVTLHKTERDYSPTTLYEDYAISETLFHWQSQSTTSVESPTGQRYIHHAERGVTVLLFVREEKKRNGLACPYVFLGPVTYVSHSGSRPISFVWQLRHPIPARLLPAALRMAAA